jgi:ribosomal protein S18 acetylase RimI-like enzyme
MKIANAIHYYKQHGVLSFLKRMFVSFGFEFFDHAVIFMVLDLNDIPDDIKEPYSFYQATVADVQQAEDYNDGWFAKKEALSRLQNGHRLFVFKEKETTIYFLWAETKKVTLNWLAMDLSIPEDMLYISGAFTLPEFRNRGIASKLKKEIFHFLKKEGIKKLIGVVIPSNTTALLIDKKLGFKEYQTITYKRYGYFRHYKVQKFNSGECKTFITLFKAPKDIWITFL